MHLYAGYLAPTGTVAGLEVFELPASTVASAVAGLNPMLCLLYMLYMRWCLLTEP